MLMQNTPTIRLECRPRSRVQILTQKDSETLSPLRWSKSRAISRDSSPQTVSINYKEKQLQFKSLNTSSDLSPSPTMSNFSSDLTHHTSSTRKYNSAENSPQVLDKVTPSGENRAFNAYNQNSSRHNSTSMPSLRRGNNMSFARSLVDSKFKNYGRQGSVSYSQVESSVLSLHWVRKSSKFNVQPRPSHLMNASIVTLGRKAFLYGGIKQDGVSNQLWTYKPYKDNWKLLEAGEIPPRAGHCSVVIKNQIFVFGGETSESKNTAISRCSNDLYCYNPNLNQWNQIKPSSQSKDFITPRKHAAACGFNNFLFVLGGIDSIGTVLGDLWVFSTGNYSRFAFTKNNHLSILSRSKDLEEVKSQKDRLT